MRNISPWSADTRINQTSEFPSRCKIKDRRDRRASFSHYKSSLHKTRNTESSVNEAKPDATRRFSSNAALNRTELTFASGEDRGHSGIQIRTHVCPVRSRFYIVPFDKALRPCLTFASLFLLSSSGKHRTTYRRHTRPFNSRGRKIRSAGE